MLDADDRLAGDFVWEMFPAAPARPSRGRRLLGWAELAALVATAWAVFPPAAVAVACLAAAGRDLRSGWRISKAIPDKAGGRICGRFAYAWGAWKSGATAFASIFLAAIASVAWDGRSERFPQAALAALWIWIGGFLAAAFLAGAGLVEAYRSGMRVWVGEGLNRARTLLLSMLVVGFTCVVLIPACVLLASAAPTAADGDRNIVPVLIGFSSITFVGPVILLIFLDRFSRRVVADRPGKYGPKVPTVGQWG